MLQRKFFFFYIFFLTLTFSFGIEEADIRHSENPVRQTRNVNLVRCTGKRGDKRRDKIGGAETARGSLGERDETRMRSLGGTGVYAEKRETDHLTPVTVINPEQTRKRRKMNSEEAKNKKIN